MKFLVIFLLTLQSLQANELSKITLNELVHLIPLWEVPANSPLDVKGDNGKAYGYYQITPIMVDDFNRISGKTYRHEDCFDIEKSREIAEVVLTHYANHIVSQGYTLRVSHLLYIWNGGGGAWRRVHYRVDDIKQQRLERYYAKAMVFINKFYEQKKIKHEKRAQEPFRGLKCERSCVL